MTVSQTRLIGLALIALGALAGFAISVFNYFSRSSGIDGTEGALLVVASCAAITLAAGLSPTAGRWSWPSRFLFLLTFLGIIGTGLAAYFLTSLWLQAAMGASLIGWFIALLRPRTQAVARDEHLTRGVTSS